MKIRSRKIKWLILVCLTISIVFIFGSGTIIRAQEEEKYPTWKEWGEKYWPTKPVRGGYLRRAATRYVGMMNPNHWPVGDWTTHYYIFDKPMFRDGTYKANVPWLAKSWEFLDPYTVIMKFHEGVTFHDGSEFSAETVKYQVEWILDKKNGAWSKAYLRNLKSTEVLDKHTIKWSFKNKWGAFLDTVPAGVVGMQLSAKALAGDSALREVKSLKRKAAKARKKADRLKKKAEAGTEKEKTAAAKAEKKAAKLEKEAKAAATAAKGAKNFDTNPVGTGKYMLEKASPGNYVKLKRNPNWWFGKSIGHPDMPYLDGVIISVIPDPAVQLANLRAGKIDTMNVDKANYDLIKDDPNLYVYKFPGNAVASLFFNHAEGPSKNILVRKAVSHAIDRKALIIGTQFGLGRIASSGFPEDHWAHNPNLKPVSYDPELSKKLLAEAGYPGGLSIKGHGGSSPAAITINEAIKAMLKKVGIDWQVDALDQAASSDRVKNREYDLISGGYSNIWEPDIMLTNLYHPKGGFNYGRSNNKKAIELMEIGKNETNQSKRQKIYFELEKALYDNYEDAWLWWAIYVVAYNKKVQGYNNEMNIKFREGFDRSHPLWLKDGK